MTGCYSHSPHRIVTGTAAIVTNLSDLGICGTQVRLELEAAIATQRPQCGSEWEQLLRLAALRVLSSSVSAVCLLWTIVGIALY